MQLICNTSPIIGLLAIGRSAILRAMFGSVVFPRAVHDELFAADHLHRRDAELIEQYISDGVLSIYQVQDTRKVKELYGRLHKGELEVIVGALELNINTAIIDDLAARRFAREKGIETIGIIGLLIQAKRLGIIQHLKQDIDALRKNGIYISDGLYLRILSENGE